MALPRVSLDQNSSVGPADWYLGVGGQVCSGLIRVLAGPGLGSCRIDVRLLPIGQPSPAQLSAPGASQLSFSWEQARASTPLVPKYHFSWGDPHSQGLL